MITETNEKMTSPQEISAHAQRILSGEDTSTTVAETAQLALYGATQAASQQQRGNLLEHALMQMLELSQRQSDHFGAPRRDVVERAKEALSMLDNPLNEFPRYRLEQMIKCRVLDHVCEGKVIQCTRLESAQGVRYRYHLYLEDMTSSIEPWQDSLILCELLPIGYEFKK